MAGKRGVKKVLNEDHEDEYGWELDHHRYGMVTLTRLEYLEQLTEQEGRCSVCKRPHTELDVKYFLQWNKFIGMMCKGCTKILDAAGGAPSRLKPFLEIWDQFKRAAAAHEEEERKRKGSTE